MRARFGRLQLSVAVGRPPATVEATAYFVVAEALTNVAKHARAQRAEVNARVEGGLLDIHVREEGVGGAQPHRGGLLALDDRLAVSAVSFGSTAQSEGGTLVAAANPLPAAEGAPVMRPSEHPSDVRTASPDVAGAAARVAASSARHR